MRSEIVSARASAIALRAERGLGVAIREGQARGDVRTDEENKRMAAWKARGTFDQNCTEDLVAKPQPTDFATRHELHASSGPGIYNITDGVSDEVFAEAIAEAKDEGNLSRANVARKCRCLDCRRPLRVAKSVAAQRGPVCRSRAGVNG